MAASPFAVRLQLQESIARAQRLTRELRRESALQRLKSVVRGASAGIQDSITTAGKVAAAYQAAKAR